MNTYLNLYKGNPTSGGTNGTSISTGDMTSPFTFTLDAAENEVQSDTLAVRCETGYETCTDTVITKTGDTGDKWKLSIDGTNWSDSITFTDTIVATNTLFFVKASSSSSENPHNDTSTKINVATKIAAVS